MKTISKSISIVIISCVGISIVSISGCSTMSMQKDQMTKEEYEADAKAAAWIDFVGQVILETLVY